MLDKRLLVTGVGLCVIIAAAVVAALLPTLEADPALTENAQQQDAAEQLYLNIEGTVPVEQEPAPKPRPDTYVIREYNGRIAVFVPGSEQPEMVLEMLVKHLPEYDQRQLREGIEVRGVEELSARIEDYIS